MLCCYLKHGWPSLIDCKRILIIIKDDCHRRSTLRLHSKHWLLDRALWTDDRWHSQPLPLPGKLGLHPCRPSRYPCGTWLKLLDLPNKNFPRDQSRIARVRKAFEQHAKSKVYDN